MLLTKKSLTGADLIYENFKFLDIAAKNIEQGKKDVERQQRVLVAQMKSLVNEQETLTAVVEKADIVCHNLNLIQTTKLSNSSKKSAS